MHPDSYRVANWVMLSKACWGMSPTKEFLASWSVWRDFHVLIWELGNDPLKRFPLRSLKQFHNRYISRNINRLKPSPHSKPWFLFLQETQVGIPVSFIEAYTVKRVFAAVRSGRFPLNALSWRSLSGRINLQNCEPLESGSVSFKCKP